MIPLAKFLRQIFIITSAIYIFDQGRMWVTGRYRLASFSEQLATFGIYLMYSTVLALSNYWVVAQLNKRYSWKESPKKRAIYGAIGAIVISMISIIFLRLITVLLINQQNWSYFISHESKFVYVYSLFIALVVVLVFYVINFYKVLTSKTINEQKTIAKTETAKYETLKSQLDPHFLFNSLNVLTSLIEENPEQAERFTSKLSKVYRYVLEQKDKILIPFEEELNFAKAYMELLKMRFEGALIFETPKNISNTNYKIVPLSLQLLLENAVKHNAISAEQPLKIIISIQDDELQITNNFNKKKILNKGTGVGLLNIIERYELITDRKVIIEQTKETFSVILPLLTQKTKIMKTINQNEELRYIRAKEKVEKMKGFYANIISYVFVNTFLVILNYNTGWEHKWFIYPMIGWGIGVVFHYFEAFGHYPFLSSDWEERKINEIMNNENKEMWK